MCKKKEKKEETKPRTHGFGARDGSNYYMHYSSLTAPIVLLLPVRLPSLSRLSLFFMPPSLGVPAPPEASRSLASSSLDGLDAAFVSWLARLPPPESVTQSLPSVPDLLSGPLDCVPLLALDGTP